MAEGGAEGKRIILQNEQFMILLEERSIIFENVKSYHLWSNYFAFISRAIDVIKDVKENLFLERVGLRYVSFFEKSDMSAIQKVLKKPFLMVEDELGHIENPNFYGKFIYSRNDIDYQIQIGNKIELMPETELKEGCVIDLDISTINSLPDFTSDELYKLIDFLHHEEKLLFISILNKGFLDSLTIKY
ncbi:TIGR04255 family protein [Fibrisoma montanum]|uniref:TIGR04255 family protein n=2 Tax=Fibrisoma montanum TaxID=2305895 RepID=A0A418MJA0_9BACT|nr:TIGR04255 family protein [Fibrisoma montanum]